MKTLNFPIIDPHIHQWDPYNTPHSGALLVKMLGNYPYIMDKIARMIKPKSLIDTVGLFDYSLSPYLPRDYIKDCKEFKIESVVHVEAGWHNQQGLGVVEETRWIKSLPFSSVDVKLGAIIGAADPRDHQFANILIEHQKASLVFRGIRKMAAFHKDKGVLRWCNQAGLYTDKNFLIGFEQLARRALTFDAWAYSTQLKDISYLAGEFPEVPIVIDHLATPVGLFGPVGRETGTTIRERRNIFEQWKNDIEELARHPNVYAKISGLMMPILGHSFHKKRELASVEQIVNLLSPMIEHTIKVFGIDRIMYASNFPMDKVSAQLSDIIEAYICMILPYGNEALKAIFHQNAKHFYHIESV